MKKLFYSFLVIMLISAKANAQGFIADSIRSVIEKTISDSLRVSALIELSNHEYYELQNVDTAFTVAHSALKFARQKGLVVQEAELLNLLSDYDYRNGDPVTGYHSLLQAISFAREHQLHAQEANSILDLSFRLIRKPDTAQLLMAQALRIALQYKLVEQQIDALANKGYFYAASKQDSMKFYFYQALILARQSHLHKSEVNVLQKMAFIYSSKWVDSANHFMKEAIRVSQENQLTSLEEDLLQNCLYSRGGFFIKDSLISYYKRAISLDRQLHKDSLRLMDQFAQSCMDVINYPKALQTYFSVMRIAEEKKDSSILALTLIWIGDLFQAVKDYKKSIGYYSAAKQCGSKFMLNYLFCHVNMALSYIELKQKDSARFYAEKAYQLALDLYHTPDKIFGGALNTLGRGYLGLGEDSLAYDYLTRSYIYFTHAGIKDINFCESAVGLAKYFKKTENQDSSIFYAKICLLTAQENGFLNYTFDASSIIADYYQKKHHADSAYHYQQIGFEAYKTLYSDDASRQFRDMAYAEQQREQDVAQAKKTAAEKYASNLRLYALITVLVVGIMIGLIVYRNNRQRQKAFELLKKQKQEIDLQKSKLETSLSDLQTTQSQLIQSEKMASLGELTAGIAHEIQNPLNFVNNFSDVNKELLVEMKDEIDKGNINDAKTIADDVIENEQKINHNGKRADAIVKGMLQHSRSSVGVKEPTYINALADEYLRLSYHGLRAKDNSFNATTKIDFDKSIGKINIIPQDIGRVLLNLYNNAFYAVSEKKKSEETVYEPVISVNTKKIGDKVFVSVKDNGNGIPQKVIDKIFQPFFTTTPTGQGTGLGLSLSYDIVKAHGGEIKVNTKEGEFTEFLIQLPIST